MTYRRYCYFVLISIQTLMYGSEKSLCAPAHKVTKCATLVVDHVDNLDTVKKEIKKYYYSNAWDRSHQCIARKIKDVLKTYLPVGNKKLAIIFDIDDTLLSTWEINLFDDFGYIKERHRAWEMEAKAPAIKPMLDLYNFAKEAGFANFLLTGREEFQRQATIKNLHKVGFYDWKALYLKPPAYVGLPACMYKSRYREIIAGMGYTLVANIGDQLSDMGGTTQAEHNFKLSNPMYAIP